VHWLETSYNRVSVRVRFSCVGLRPPSIGLGLGLGLGLELGLGVWV